MQRRLAREHAGYQAFLSRAGGAWSALFDEESGNPISIVGSGIRVSTSPIRDVNTASTLATDTIARFPELWGARLADLHHVNTVKTGPLYVATWRQEFGGLEVRGARVQIQIHEAGRVASLSTTAIPIPPGYSRTSRLTSEEAQDRVKAGKRLLSADSVTAADLLIFPKSSGGASIPRVAFVVDVRQPSAEVYERVYVDAENGEILEVESTRTGFDIKGKVSGWTNPSLNPSAAPVVVPLSGVRVETSAGSATTDVNGDYLIPTTLSGPFTVQAFLSACPGFSVTVMQGSNLVASGLTASSGGQDIANLLFNSTPIEFGTSQTNAAYHHGIVKSYTKAKIPSFVPIPSQPIRVNKAETCNAYYYYGDQSMEFFAAGGGCVNTAFSTIIYHEFGHGVDYAFGGVPSDALGEALADILAMYVTGQAIVGTGFFGPGTFVRTGENSKVWPASSCNSEPHCVGETFMGFAWQARKLLVAKCGAEIGASIAEADFLGIAPVNNVSILTAVVQVFLLDDNDGDLLNGTPHFAQLSAAAAVKGFVPPVVSAQEGAKSAYFPVAHYKTGSVPQSIAAADLNGDARADLVVANKDSNNVTVLTCQATGSFGSEGNYGVDSSPTSVAVADVNHDSAPDVLVCNSGSNSVSVLLGDHCGAFAPASHYPALGNGATALDVQDLNLDGSVDIVVANSSSNDVSVLLGIPSGGFQAASKYPCNVNPVSVRAGDLNNDGRADLVTSNAIPSSVSVLLGNPGGVFGSPTSFPTGPNTGPTSVAIGDTDGDGTLDVVTANPTPSSASLLLGVGNGTLGSASSIPLGPNSGPRFVLLRDVNGDSNLDILASNPVPSSVAVCLGFGGGSFFTQHFSSGSSTGPVECATADFNQDGALDIATANSTSANNTTVLMGTGAFGEFVIAQRLSVNTPLSAIAGDFNHDGHVDLACTNYDLNSVSVQLSSGYADFMQPTYYPSHGDGPEAMATGDMNLDGNLDLVVANYNTGKSVTVLLGSSSGVFSHKSTTGVPGFPIQLALGDLNGDGKLDMATAGAAANNFTLLFGDGMGGVTSIDAGSGGGLDTESIAIGDLDNDAIPDLVVSNYLSDNVAIRRGLGSGNFTAPVTFPVGGGHPEGIALGDVNGDSTLDVVTANAGSNDVSILLGNGAGQLGLPETHAAGVNPRMCVIGDLTGDGRSDIAVANRSSASVSVLAGGPLQTLFSPAMHFATDASCQWLTISDLNLDGQPDLMTANYSSNSVSILMNQRFVGSSVESYGPGTPGCLGRLGIQASAIPKVNSPAFGLACTNTPPDSLGLGIVTNAVDNLGTDPFGIGVKLHVDLLSATEVLTFDFDSDGSGIGFAKAPIPANPNLVGSIYYVQVLWVEVLGYQCGVSPLNLITSRGLKLTIQG